MHGSAIRRVARGRIRLPRQDRPGPHAEQDAPRGHHQVVRHAAACRSERLLLLCAILAVGMAVRTEDDSVKMSSRFAKTDGLAVSLHDDSADGVLPSRTWTVVVMVGGDVVSLALAAFFAGLIDNGWAPLLRYDYVLLFVPAAYGIAGLYPAVGVNPIDEFRRLTIATSAVFVASLAGMAVIGRVAPSSAWVLVGVLALATVPIGRAIVREVFARRSWWGVPVVVLGAGRTAILLIDRLQSRARIGMKPIACLDDDATKIGTAIRGVPVTGPLAHAHNYSRRGVRHVLVAMPVLEPHDLVPLLARYGRGFPAMLVVPNLFGVASVGVDTRDLGGVLGLLVKHNLASRTNRYAKAVLDVFLLVPALLVGVPVIALAALAVLVVSPGNPFYGHARVGRKGRIIRVWKLRTMRPDADVVLGRYLAEHPEARAEWKRHFKLSEDPRVIPLLGSFLRASSLDELPQIFNVLRGEMSFVGPRPFPPYHLEAFSDDFRQLRSMVRPGITGLWQVMVRSDGDLEVQERLDTYYIRNWSIWMDLYVLARTPLAVLSAKGAR